MRRLLTPGWIAAHVTAAVLVISFLLLGWWQVRRAAGGNLLSFGYAIEWPVFAGFVIFVWLKEARRALRLATSAESAGSARVGSAGVGSAGVGSAGVGSAGVEDAPARTHSPVRPVRVGPAYDDTDDAELAAYNRYLAWLNAHPHASPGDYPG